MDGMEAEDIGARRRVKVIRARREFQARITLWYPAPMEIRPGNAKDLDLLSDIDGTIESTRYLHLEQSAGEGLAVSWRLEERALREKVIDPNRLTDEAAFLVKQIVTGADEGLVFVAEHESAPVAVLVAHRRPELNTLHIVDLRIDYEQRRQYSSQWQTR